MRTIGNVRGSAVRLSAIVFCVTAALLGSTANGSTFYVFNGTDLATCSQCTAQLQLSTDGGPIVSPAFARGALTSAGGSLGPQTNDGTYVAGVCDVPECSSRLEIRNWFAFGLAPGRYSSITDATLLITVPNLSPPAVSVLAPFGDPQYTVHAVVRSEEGLFINGPSLPQFVEIASGMPYGSRIITASDQGKTIAIPLNADAIAYLADVHRTFTSSDPIGGIAVIGGVLTLPAMPLPSTSWQGLLVLTFLFGVAALTVRAGWVGSKSLRRRCRVASEIVWRR